MMNMKPLKLFYSYAGKDEKFRLQLEKHLSSLKRQGKISAWHFRMITGGTQWKGEIDQHINDANIILLLISADFLASDYCYDVEMRTAMRLHNSKKSRVIPVILRPCDWHDAPFGKLQALPEDGKPVTKWADIDESFLNIVEGIKIVLNENVVFHRVNAKSISKLGDESPNLRQTQSTNTYCSRCGAKAGKQSECTGDYVHHRFQDYYGDVFCSRCGVKPGEQSECTGIHMYHQFKEYAGVVYCARCGVKAGKQGECTGDYVSHQFKEYPSDVYCIRCGAKAGKQSECTGIYTFHNFQQ